ncbi:Leucine Rich repeats (2 copies) [Anatilimnocola aggregata]|uniref:Leucine Rich repeats (2 copies) n=2 Tax=Anatilimnocola aggregata TaxID=2528021 RepID=A0A517Y6Y6_9BACT|nr:Leucine Rich repeats (2 copies) [Anatilimnocola aggregata]
MLAMAAGLPRYRSMTQRFAAKRLAEKGIELVIHPDATQSHLSWLVFGDNRYDWVRDIVIADVAISNADVSLLKQFPSARQLFVSDCRSANKMLEQIRTFKWLGLVQIERSPVCDQDVQELSHLKHLTSLVLIQPADAEFDLSRLGSHPSLLYLHLRGRAFTDKTVIDVSKIEGLNTFTIDDASITDDGVRHLGKLTQLYFLSITSCRVTGASLDTLSACPQLEHLSLSRCQIDRAGTLQIARLPQVRKVDLYSTSVTKADIVELEKATKLVFSDFMFNQTP